MTTLTDPQYPRMEAPAGDLDKAVDRIPGATLRREVLAELEVKIAKPDVTFEVPTRPGWSVRYATKLDADLLREWTKTASGDQFTLSLLTLAGQCRGIVRQGEEMGFTFASPEFRDLYKALDATVAVRAFFGDDVAVSSAYIALIEACSSGAQVVTVDPTNGSAT